MSEGIFGCHTWGVLPASGGQRTKGLVHILKWTGQPPPTNNFPSSNVSRASVEKLNYCYWFFGASAYHLIICFLFDPLVFLLLIFYPFGGA